MDEAKILQFINRILKDCTGRKDLPEHTYVRKAEAALREIRTILISEGADQNLIELVEQCTEDVIAMKQYVEQRGNMDVQIIHQIHQREEERRRREEEERRRNGRC